MSVFGAVVMLGYAWGTSNGDVTVELIAKKVVKSPDGTQRLESAERAKPGELIEYVAIYRNTGTEGVSNLQATLPVPDGMEYLPGTARPEPVLASTDGKTFQKVPLRRKVRLPNGTETDRDVPPAEYRSLRWDLNTLQPGGSVTVRAWMKITAAGELTINKPKSK
jgi:uncharacterized repeat protein (TIGR01451 family)